MSFDLSKKLLIAKSMPKVGQNQTFKMEYCDQLIEHMFEGFSFATFALQCGCHPSTLDNWTEKFEEFAAAKEMAFLARQLFWEETIKKSATGETKASAASIIFALKNYFPEAYKDKYETEHTGNVQFLVDTGIHRPQIEGSSALLPDVETSSEEVSEPSDTDLL